MLFRNSTKNVVVPEDWVNFELMLSKRNGGNTVLSHFLDDFESVARKFDTSSLYFIAFCFASVSVTETKGFRSLIIDNGKSRTAKIMTPLPIEFDNRDSF